MLNIEPTSTTPRPLLIATVGRSEVSLFQCLHLLPQLQYPLAMLSVCVSCRQGTCTTCCAKLPSGRVSQPKQNCIPPSAAEHVTPDPLYSPPTVCALPSFPCPTLLHCLVPRRQGTCTACCAKLLSGRVSQPKQKCIPPALLKQGYVALCCATPASDVKLQTHQGPTIKKWKAEQANV